MEKSTILISLTLFTLLAGLAVAAYQLWATDRAEKMKTRVDGTKERPNA